MRRLVTLMVALLTLLAGAGAAHAKAPDYVGTWGTTAAQCRVPQEQQGAPMAIRANGYDQHETHCDFTSIARRGDGWRIRTRCSIEGDAQTHTMTLNVAGQTLMLGGGSRPPTRLIRCP